MAFIGWKVPAEKSAEGSFGAGMFRKHMHRHSRVVPVNGHDEYCKGGTARFFALCAERLSVQRAFLICDEYCSLRQFYYGKNIDESGSDRILPDEKEDNRKHE